MYKILDPGSKVGNSVWPIGRGYLIVREDSNSVVYTAPTKERAEAEIPLLDKQDKIEKFIKEGIDFLTDRIATEFGVSKDHAERILWEYFE